jgi:uncharacterized membrane protein
MTSDDRALVLSKHRLEGLSDGVFAVVMTLLVLEIKPEHLGPNATDAEVWSSIRELARPLAAYAFTFALTGAFWVTHHRKFMLISRTTIRHTFLTLAFLFAVSLLPLSISLWVPRLGRGPAILIYYANFALIALTLLISWFDALQSRLVSGEPAAVNTATVRITSIATGAVLGAIVAWFDVSAAGFAVIIGILGGRRLMKYALRHRIAAAAITPGSEPQDTVATQPTTHR